VHRNLFPAPCLFPQFMRTFSRRPNHGSAAAASLSAAFPRSYSPPFARQPKERKFFTRPFAIHRGCAGTGAAQNDGFEIARSSARALHETRNADRVGRAERGRVERIADSRSHIVRKERLTRYPRTCSWHRSSWRVPWLSRKRLSAFTPSCNQVTGVYELEFSS
jgi:hypothetical protein